MPWYWTDDIAAALANRDRDALPDLVEQGKGPIAIRRAESTFDELLEGLEDDGETPLAA